MRGSVRVLLWALILLACAGVGAFVASRSNPFPPEVSPERPTRSPPSDGRTGWLLSLDSRTTHTLRVGGACTSDWRMRARIRVTVEGVVRGTGRARLQPGARCDFETAQVQTRAVNVRITGTRADDRLRLRFEIVNLSPPGSQDLGGFVETLPRMRFTIPERAGGSSSGPTRVEVADDTHVARTSVRLGGA